MLHVLSEEKICSFKEKPSVSLKLHADEEAEYGSGGRMENFRRYQIVVLCSPALLHPPKVPSPPTQAGHKKTLVKLIPNSKLSLQ